MSAHNVDEHRAQKLRQRLWGATIIIALAVIFLPLLLDGSGSESQFRRVEQLREEPPRVINIDGSREIVNVPDSRPKKKNSWWARMVRRFTDKSPDMQRIGGNKPIPRPDIDEVIEPPAKALPEPEPTSDAALTGGALNDDTALEHLQAWVVQAGSFSDYDNAVAVRDRLRSAGYPSFVTPKPDGDVFRVHVGPMINKSQASGVRDKVASILGREALLKPYP